MTSPADPRSWRERPLRVWFDELGPDDWFRTDDAVDAMLEREFAEDWRREKEREADAFVRDAETARAAILLFDQIPRNIHRGTARAYATDPLALRIAHRAIARGWVESMTQEQAQFALMPLMHSEDLADQDLSVRLFARHAPGALEFARSHRDAIARFGRFPHRNALLGRETTPEERQAIADGLAW